MSIPKVAKGIMHFTNRHVRPAFLVLAVIVAVGCWWLVKVQKRHLAEEEQIRWLRQMMLGRMLPTDNLLRAEPLHEVLKDAEKNRQILIRDPAGRGIYDFHPDRGHVSSTVEELDRHLGQDADAAMQNPALDVRDRAGRLLVAGRFDEAIHLYDEALAAQTAPSRALLTSKGDALCAAYKWDDAIKTYQRALGLISKEQRPLTWAAAASRVMFACRAKGHYFSEEPLAREIISIREKKLGPDDPRLVESINNLALLLNNLGVEQRNSDIRAGAEPQYLRALKIIEKNHAGKSRMAATVFFNLALLMEDVGKNAAAEQYFKQALDIDTSAPPWNPWYVARDRDHLVALMIATHQFDMAERFGRGAQEIYEGYIGPDHPYVATGLFNLAIAKRFMGRYEEALTLFRQALEIDEKSLGKDHQNVARDLSEIGLQLYYMARNAEAEQPLRRAVAIYEKQLGKDDPTLAPVLHNLAKALTSPEKHAEKEALFRRALEIDEKSYGLGSVKAASRMFDLAEIVRFHHPPGEAELLYRQALEAYEKNGEVNNMWFVMRLQELGRLLCRDQRYAEAEPIYRRAIMINTRLRILSYNEYPAFGGAIDEYARVLVGLGWTEKEAKQDAVEFAKNVEQEAKGYKEAAEGFFPKIMSLKQDIHWNEAQIVNMEQKVKRMKADISGLKWQIKTSEEQQKELDQKIKYGVW